MTAKEIHDLLTQLQNEPNGETPEATRIIGLLNMEKDRSNEILLTAIQNSTIPPSVISALCLIGIGISTLRAITNDTEALARYLNMEFSRDLNVIICTSSTQDADVAIDDLITRGILPPPAKC